MAANWLAVVGEGDEVWHLGDFMVGRRVDPAALLAQLPGRKHLVTGNNDAPALAGLPGYQATSGTHPLAPLRTQPPPLR